MSADPLQKTAYKTTHMFNSNRHAPGSFIVYICLRVFLCLWTHGALGATRGPIPDVFEYGLSGGALQDIQEGWRE